MASGSSVAATRSAVSGTLTSLELAMAKPYDSGMKRAIVLLAIGFLTACGSGKPAPPARVHIQIVQLTGITSSQPEGPFDVQLGLQVENLTNAPITLKHIDL